MSVLLGTCPSAAAWAWPHRTEPGALTLQSSLRLPTANPFCMQPVLITHRPLFIQSMKQRPPLLQEAFLSIPVLQAQVRTMHCAPTGLCLQVGECGSTFVTSVLPMPTQPAHRPFQSGLWTWLFPSRAYWQVPRPVSVEDGMPHSSTKLLWGVRPHQQPQRHTPN